MENPKFKLHPILWYLIGVIVVGFLARCNSDLDLSGSRFPGDTEYTENRAIEQEYLEGKEEVETLRSDPCLEDIIHGVPEEYSRCGTSSNSSSDKLYESYESSTRDNTSITSNCSCANNTYNCKDFATQREAQACYDHCLSIVGYDIHWLDDDDDGRACELNP
jgi:hypothetical protein